MSYYGLFMGFCPIDSQSIYDMMKGEFSATTKVFVETLTVFGYKNTSLKGTCILFASIPRDAWGKPVRLCLVSFGKSYDSSEQMKTVAVGAVDITDMREQ